MMTKARSNKIIKLLYKMYADISPELKYKDIYQLTIAVILSAQTTDKQVNTATPELFKKYPAFKSLSKAKVADVETYIKTVGLYKTKAKNIVKLSKDVILKHNGILPDTLEKLVELPGIGRKSANVILSQGFGKNAFAVDTHVIRIANRIGYIRDTHDAYKVEKSVTEFVPEYELTTAHLTFI